MPSCGFPDETDPKMARNETGCAPRNTGPGGPACRSTSRSSRAVSSYARVRPGVRASLPPFLGEGLVQFGGMVPVMALEPARVVVRRVIVHSLRHQLTLHHCVMQEEPLLVGHRFLIEPHLVLRDRATAIMVAEVAEFLIDVLPHVRSIHEPHRHRTAPLETLHVGQASPLLFVLSARRPLSLWAWCGALRGLALGFCRALGGGLLFRAHSPALESGAARSSSAACAGERRAAACKSCARGRGQR